MKKKVSATIERANDEGIWVCAEIDGNLCIGSGPTPEEAKADFWVAYGELREVNEALPPAEDLDVEFKYDMFSFLRQFREEFSMSGLEVITGINQKQLHHYLSGQSRPSAATKKKIQEGIAAFAAKLTAIQFA